eukprot:TRINITY_DN12484_c0_g1_i1.p1 TRINITY_DN12484_c0_g1~~TRINITY_DN12484_c0_g1_i1.p1  ORF type:complete len:238 (+),score=59.90 TRINITY_DN12484_c0_g1_i1:95-715(+)
MMEGKTPPAPLDIEQTLEENRLLVAAIVENQNLGKLQECVKYQAILHNNLLTILSVSENLPSLLALASETTPTPPTFHTLPRPKLQPEDCSSSSSSNPHSTPTSHSTEVLGHSVPTDEPVPHNVSYWSRDEHQRFMEGVRMYGTKDLKRIADHVKTRTHVQVRTHLTKYLQKVNKQQKRDQQLLAPPPAQPVQQQVPVVYPNWRVN